MTIEKRSTGDKVVDRALRPIRRTVNELTRGLKGVTEGVNVLRDGQISFKHIGTVDGDPTGDGIDLVDSSVTRIKHQLGRKLLGWVVTDVRDASAGFRIERVLSSGGDDADDTEDLWLKPTGSNVTIRLLVY